ERSTQFILDTLLHLRYGRCETCDGTRHRVRCIRDNGVPCRKTHHGASEGSDHLEGVLHEREELIVCVHTGVVPCGRRRLVAVLVEPVVRRERLTCQRVHRGDLTECPRRHYIQLETPPVGERQFLRTGRNTSANDLAEDRLIPANLVQEIVDLLLLELEVRLDRNPLDLLTGRRHEVDVPTTRVPFAPVGDDTDISCGQGLQTSRVHISAGHENVPQKLTTIRRVDRLCA